MNRLNTEIQRLYGPLDASPSDDAPARLMFANAHGQVRALVLGVVQGAGWDALAPLWQAVQADLELPAPAIAVAGDQGYQLWFSLEQPVDADQAARFLEGLRRRYLPAVAAARLRLVPSPGAAASGHEISVPRVPAPQGVSGNWSAFVASDLAAVFTDEPWLDLPPGSDAQAELLSRLRSIKPADFERAMQQLKPLAAPAAATAVAPPTGRPQAATQDPRQFLLGVMNDNAVDLRLRIEAAKALLPPP